MTQTVRVSVKLNLVVDVDLASGATGFVHAMPVGQEVFEKWFLLFGKAFAAVFEEGLTVASGPRVAYHLMKRIAVNMKAWEGPDGVENTLIAEIYRLSNLTYPGEGQVGWQVMPLEEALRKKLLDEEAADELINALCFFCLASRMAKRLQRQVLLDGMGGLWVTRTTPWSLSELLASLPMSNGTDASPTPEGSSVPS